MRTTRLTRIAAFLGACSLLTLPAAANAQQPKTAPTPAAPSTSPAPAAPAAPSPPAADASPSPAGASPAAADAKPPEPAREPVTTVEKAKVHYDRGIQLYAEENFDAALTEFERAYELAPNYKILYSLALIQRHQNNYAAALANFQRYLREGGAGLSDDRRSEVEKEIAVLKPRCATVQIKANVDGADVFVDDESACASTSMGKCFGKTPIVGAIIVNPGRRKIVASKAGYATATSIVTLVGLDAISVNLELTSLNHAEPKVDVGPRNRAIIAWSATGVFGAAAAVTGVFALNAQSKLKTDRDGVGADPNALSHDAKQVKTLSLVADIFTVTAVVGGLVSTYFTYKALRANPQTDARAREKQGSVGFDVGPTGARVFGQF